jgi:hypothetical protein
MQRGNCRMAPLDSQPAVVMRGRPDFRRRHAPSPQTADDGAYETGETIPDGKARAALPSSASQKARNGKILLTNSVQIRFTA